MYLSGGGNIMDNLEMKKVVIHRIELEAERAELYEQVPSVEKKIKQFTYLTDEAQLSLDNLKNSKGRQFIYGLIGQKETRLQEAENELRKVRGDLRAAEFELGSIKDRIESIGLELNITESTFDEFIKLLESEDKEDMKERLLAVKELPNLRHLIREKMVKLKQLLKKAEEIWVYGDIQADLSGRRYNRKDTTLREHTVLLKQAVSELVVLLEQYNSYAPEETKVIFHEDWMNDEKYWDGQQLAEDSHARIQKVDDWFFRFESVWNKMKKQQNEAEEILRSEVLEYLR